ncbi:scavenger receptor cysteine-rich type 1 protein M130-like [Cariama cristata]
MLSVQGQKLPSECRSSIREPINCHHEEDAGVVCSVLRLVNGSSLCAGRVEVFHKHQWGTVCDDSWDEEDAAVVCWQLGCGMVVSAPGAAWFGQGSNTIWVDNMNSTGREETFSECLSRPWGTHNCDHGEDAGVVCSASVTIRPPQPLPLLPLLVSIIPAVLMLVCGALLYQRRRFCAHGGAVCL